MVAGRSPDTVRLLTTASEQPRAREVCAQASPPNARPAASLLPARPQLRKTFSKGCQVAGEGGVTPRGDPEVEPPWVDPLQRRAEISPPEQRRAGMASLNGWVGRGCSIKSSGGNLSFPPRPQLHLFSPPQGCEFSSTLEAVPPLPSSCQGGHRPQATGQVFRSLSI